MLTSLLNCHSNLKVINEADSMFLRYPKYLPLFMYKFFLNMENYFKIPYFVTGSDLPQEFIPSDICPANEDDELFNLAISGNKGNFWIFQHLSPFNTCKLKPDFFLFLLLFLL